MTRTPGIFVLPTGCPLANDVIVALRVPLDASGFGSFSLPIDPAGTRRTLYLQYLGVSDPVGGPWEFVSSNQVRADLPGTP